MKLKPIVASLALLATGSTFAAYHAQMQTAASNAKVAKLQAELDRNQNPYYAEADWFKRITISGLVQSYAEIESRDHVQRVAGVPVLRRFPTGNNKFSSDLWLNRANVYVDADVNKWITTHVALNLTSLFGGAAVSPYAALFDENTFNRYQGVNEANVIIGNFDESPFYSRVGRLYARYGWYQRNVVPQTLPQMLTESQVDGVEIGFADMSGFNGSAVAFRGARNGANGSTNINNFALQLGYGMDQGDWGGAISVDFMYNLSGSVNAIIASNLVTPNVFNKVTPGLSAEAKAHWNQFDIMGSYTTALSRFAPINLAYFENGRIRGALPSAFLAGLGYSFPVMGMDSRLGVNFQMSFQSTNVLTGMPMYRAQADYDINMFKNTDLQFTFHWDRDYNRANRGTQQNLFVGLVGLSAKFA